jgi:hypothetical protein
MICSQSNDLFKNDLNAGFDGCMAFIESPQGTNACRDEDGCDAGKQVHGRFSSDLPLF